MLMPPRFLAQGIRWDLCACGGRELHKIQRRWWMRMLFPRRRLYQCGLCKEQVFLSLLR